MINPLYWLELRIRAREKRLWLIALFFVLSLLTISGVVLASVLIPWRMGNSEPSGIGEGLTWAALFCQAGLLMILAPLATAGRISQEREQRTLAALVNSPVSPARTALGKLLGSWTFVFWLGILALPFLFTATLWGGPTWKLILVCLGVNFLAGLVLSSISLGLSGLFGRSLTAYLVTGSFLFGWMAVMPLLGSLAMGLNSSGGRWYQEIVGYLTLYHNPFFPLWTLVAYSSSGLRLDADQMVVRIVYCLCVWLVLAAGSFALAVRGLRREVY